MVERKGWHLRGVHAPESACRGIDGSCVVYKRDRYSLHARSRVTELGMMEPVIGRGVATCCLFVYWVGYPDLAKGTQNRAT